MNWLYFIVIVLLVLGGIFLFRGNLVSIEKFGDNLRRFEELH